MQRYQDTLGYGVQKHLVMVSREYIELRNLRDLKYVRINILITKIWGIQHVSFKLQDVNPSKRAYIFADSLGERT